MSGELARLRPRLVVATFEQWTNRELDLRQEAASASELKENLVAESGFFVPEIDWSRTSRRVLTLEWIDGIRLADREALLAAGHDVKALAATLVRAFLRQAVVDGFFHADLHQGNLFVLADGRLAAIDFGDHGPDRPPGADSGSPKSSTALLTGNYRRVAEIHFEAQYVPPHHNIDEFATALRAVGEPHARDGGEGRFARPDARRPVQDHPRFRHADPAAFGGRGGDRTRSRHQYVGDRRALPDRMGAQRARPEARIADEIIRTVRLIRKLPELIRRIDHYYPPPGAAPPAPPLREVVVIRPLGWLRTLIVAALGAAAGAAAIWFLV